MPIPVIGMLFVALVLGELASQYPVAGALHQYSKFSVGFLRGDLPASHRPAEAREHLGAQQGGSEQLIALRGPCLGESVAAVPVVGDVIVCRRLDDVSRANHSGGPPRDCTRALRLDGREGLAEGVSATLWGPTARTGRR